MSARRLALAVLCLIGFSALAVPAGAYSQATELSQLACEPQELVPGDQAICYIYVYDTTGEPTAAFDSSDFQVSVQSRRTNVAPIVSGITVTSDPTVGKFTVTAMAGTTLVVRVALRVTGTEIVDSGLRVAVEGKAIALGPISCDKAEALCLRDTTTCTVPLIGDEGAPALVAQTDVFFSEDHGAGSFTFLRGNKVLMFNFTAPPYLMVNFSAFHVRLSLAGSASTVATDIPIIYPDLPATARSTVRCVDGTPQICILTASDNTGPVRAAPSAFVVTFEEQINSASSTPQWIAYNGMNMSWQPGNTLGSSRLFSFEMSEPDAVFLGRANIYSVDNRTSPPSWSPIIGSPYYFTSGPAPTGDAAFFRGCDNTIVLSLSTTNCYIEVADDVIADPSYFTVYSGGQGTAGSVTYGHGPEGRPRLSFHFTSPIVAMRTELWVHITVGGANIQRSPFRMVVYPRETQAPPTAKDSTIGWRLFLGYAFFGGSTLLGIFVALQIRKGHGHGSAALTLIQSPITLIKSARHRIFGGGENPANANASADASAAHSHAHEGAHSHSH